jgi:hypothetical protein
LEEDYGNDHYGQAAMSSAFLLRSYVYSSFMIGLRTFLVSFIKSYLLSSSPVNFTAARLGFSLSQIIRTSMFFPCLEFIKWNVD